MSPLLLVNGEPPADPACAVAANDRGLNYGDGLFETALLQQGSVRFLAAHLLRLREGCERLGIEYPGDDQLTADISKVGAAPGDGVIKIVVTRGGGRGYRPLPGIKSTRIVTRHPRPDTNVAGLKVRWCDIRLSRNPVLAGLKHLNRLEEVLAQIEFSETDCDEGLLMDTEGELVSATAGNVFIVRNLTLATPDLRYCGVRGVMRAQVLRVAAEQGIAVSEEPLRPQDLQDATEVFITNAVRGIRPVTTLNSQRWSSGSMVSRLTTALGL